MKNRLLNILLKDLLKKNHDSKIASDEDKEEGEWADPKERNKKKNKNNNEKKKEENSGGGINFGELIRLFR